jgi:hypothetical protein
MKINLKHVGIAVLTAAILCGAAACVDQDADILGTDAQLLSLRIGSVTVPKVPAPINDTTWESGVDIYDEEFQSAQFNKESEITNARIWPKLSKDATAEWGIGKRTVRPGEFFDTRVPATFESDEYIYLKVTSGDKAKVNYYRYHTKVFSWVTDLASITIAEREAKSAVGTEELNNLYGIPDTNDMMGSISITRKEATGAVITPTTFDPNAKVRFGKVTGSGAPDFQPSTTAITFDDLDYLYVEVTAENTVDKTYFKFRVNVGRIATIKHLELDGVELFGTGLPNSVWASVGPGEYSTASVNQPAEGFDVKITLEDDDPEALYFYKVTNSISAPLTNNSDYDNRRTKFNTGDYLAIMVRAPNGGIRNYYHIKVTLLAGNVKAHPKSAWYYQGTPAAPLTIEFADGTDTSRFTYQWYEADSLFGIYGRHGMSMDEKNNISTINGGPDMYYYLSKPGIDQMGKPVPASYNENDPTAMGPLAWKADDSRGAKTASYMPRTDWVNVPIKLPPNSAQNKSWPYVPSSPSYDTGPTDDDPPEGGWPTHADNHVNFFTGSTSEVRYYWVVVTDSGTGLTVTSDRAVILTETDPSMDHYIFELSTLPRKNVKPFTYLREPYHIILKDWGYKFPDGFDPSKYDVCIAQAQYYLPDGRPWTQNWTHGDMLFGYIEGSDSYHKNQDQLLTWWHNNLGSNSGAIPLHTPHSAQGGLSFPPDFIGFQPSGDKGRGLPPTVNGQLPIGLKPAGFPEGAAQGYFCGFIELMELRFATKPTN